MADKIVQAILGASSHSREIICVDKFLEDEAVALLSHELELLDKEVLILRGNHIGDKGARAMASLIRNNKYLKHLELNWNQISCSGVKEIAAALKSNLVLSHLDFRNNYIKDKGAIALATVLKVNETLKVLDLRWNQISDNGALPFKETLSIRSAPLITYLSGNLLSEKLQALTQEWANIALEDTAKGDNDEYIYQPPKLSVNRIIELESINQVVESDSKQLRDEYVSLQDMYEDAQKQLDASAVEVAKLEQLRSRDQFNEAQLKESLRAAKTRIIEQTEEKRLLTDMWDRERSETLERIRDMIAEKESQTVIILSERDSLANKVRRLLEDKTNAEQQMDVITQQLASTKAKNETDTRTFERQLADLHIVNASLQAEVQNMRENVDFAVKTQKAKEEELETLRITNERTLSEERRGLESIIERLRSELATQLSLANEAATKQREEILDIYTKYNASEALLTRQNIELRKACDEAVSSARERERERCDATIKELRQQVENYETTRKDLEVRCDEYLDELRDVRVEHDTRTKTAREHIEKLQVEIDRVQAIHINVKETLTLEERKNKILTLDYSEAKQKLDETLDTSKKWHAELIQVKDERNRLQKHCHDLEEEVQLLRESRRNDFNSVATSLVRELDTLRVNMGIQQE